MDETVAAGFLSYAHDDDGSDGGGILRLAASIKAEYSLLSGEPFQLFIDRSDLSWGEQWRARIDQALVNTTFFIPILTPLYFTRPECRKEMQTFLSTAKSLGVVELVLPILFVPIPDLTEDSKDALMATAAATMYEDWTGLRLADDRSGEYRRGVNALASKLYSLSRDVAAKQLNTELALIESPNDRGLVDLMAEMNVLLQAWTVPVESDPLFQAQYSSVFDAYIPKLNRASAGKSFVIIQRMAANLLPIVEAQRDLSASYVATTLELDPLVLAAIRIIRDHPESRSALAEFEESLAAAVFNLEVAADVDRRVETGEVRLVEDFLRDHAHISQTMKHLVHAKTSNHIEVQEANQRVLQWDAQIKDLGE